MSNKKPITQLHAEVTEWISDAKLVRSETETFQKELTEIAKKNNHEEAMKGVEHFQNQFVRQTEVSDELIHDLHVIDRQLAEDAANTKKDSDLVFDRENASIKDRVETNNKIFAELKKEYHSFLEKWM